MALLVVTAPVLVSCITLSFRAPSRFVTRMTLRRAPPEPIPASRQQIALNACHRRPLHSHAIPNALEGVCVCIRNFARVPNALECVCVCIRNTAHLWHCEYTRTYIQAQLGWHCEYIRTHIVDNATHSLTFTMPRI
jgi:hypothetical protein